MKPSHLPARVTAGALILNAGLDIKKLPDEAAAGMQDMGANGVPPVKKLSPGTFRKALSRSEVALGAALLTPIAKDAIMFGTGVTLMLDDLMRTKK